jgi:hypothetical protein
MKFGFYKNGKLVDTCHAENSALAKSDIDYDEAHTILDADLLTAGTMDSGTLIADGSKEFTIFNAPRTGMSIKHK